MRNSKSQGFQDLIMWQKSHSLVLTTYKISKEFPRHELYCLTSQLRRAVISVPANIAEGYRKTSSAEKVRYLNIAQGSLEEVRYYFILASDLEYLSESVNSTLEQVDEIARIIDSYKRTILSPDS